MSTTQNNYILLIEDNEDDVELTRLAFQENNMANTVKVIMDGEKALDFLQNSDGELEDLGLPTFILLDINLPKVNGLELLEHIKSDDRLKYIPVVMLTTSKEEEDILTSYELGANSYVRKPVDYPQFVKVINNLGVYWLAVNHPPAVR